MNKQQQQIKARKDWLKIYLESGSVTKTALRCGIARCKEKTAFWILIFV